MQELNRCRGNSTNCGDAPRRGTSNARFTLLRFVAACLWPALMLPLSPATAGAPSAEPPAPVAVIYNGPGSSSDGPNAVANVAKQAGLSVKFVGEVRDIPALLPGAAVLMVGGTDDNIEPLRKRLQRQAAAEIRQYVKDGGRFVGICGGGYLASLGYDDEHGYVSGLRLAPATTDAFQEDPAARVLPIQWQGEKQNLYYQLGPKFILKPTSEAVEVVGKYSDGSVAALLCSYGKGKVLLSGPHPEAPDAWRNDFKGPADWKAHPELAVTLLRDLISARPVGKK